MNSQEKNNLEGKCTPLAEFWLTSLCKWYFQNWAYNKSFSKLFSLFFLLILTCFVCMKNLINISYLLKICVCFQIWTLNLLSSYVTQSGFLVVTLFNVFLQFQSVFSFILVNIILLYLSYDECISSLNREFIQWNSAVAC